MEKLRKVATVLVFACIIGFAISSCASSPSAPTTPAAATAPASGPFSPDSVVGTWGWADSDHAFIFSKDLSMVHRDGEKVQVDYGTWKILSVEKRTVQLQWAISENVDTLVLSADGKTLSGTNDAGGEISLIR